MKAEIQNRPAFANVHIALASGDTVIAESDAMAHMSASVRLKARLAGGFLTALIRRLFGRESMFVNEFSTETGGNLVLTQPYPGDIDCIDLDRTTVYLQPGAFVACEPTVNIGVGWAGFASLIGREGLFRLKASGKGKVWFGAYGGIWARDVDGELVVDSGHLVAYEPTLAIRVGMPAGIFSSLFGGEGLVTRVRGQGRIYLQSRSIDALAHWTNRHLW